MTGPLGGADTSPIGGVGPLIARMAESTSKVVACIAGSLFSLSAGSAAAAGGRNIVGRLVRRKLAYQNSLNISFENPANSGCRNL